jgi:uncharacterized phage protein (TIGR02218 family)
LKTVNTWLQTRLEEPAGTFAHCMLITRKDGVKLGFTDHQYSFVINSVTYTPQQATDPSSLQSDSRASVDNMEIVGVLSDAGLAKNDILIGKFDNAKLDIFIVDYTNLPTTATPGDTIWLKTMILGNTKIEDDIFRIECRSLADYLNKQIVELTSPTCRAQFGDSRCQKNLTGLQTVTTVSGFADLRNLTVTATGFSPNYFQYGKIEWLSGALNGYIADISTSTGSALTLYGKVPLAIGIGDSVRVTAGCNKLFDTCVGFANAINFQGEPHVPGIDKWKSGFQQVK